MADLSVSIFGRTFMLTDEAMLKAERSLNFVVCADELTSEEREAVGVTLAVLARLRGDQAPEHPRRGGVQ